MKDLIERLERATGPDRRLDIEIELSVHGNKPYGFKGSYKSLRPSTLREWFQQWGDEAAEDVAEDAVPRFTSSIDAAASLVPEGFKFGVGTWSGNFGNCGSDLERKAPYQNDGVAGGPAIALCIAALKALASQKEGT